MPAIMGMLAAFDKNAGVLGQHAEQPVQALAPGAGRREPSVRKFQPACSQRSIQPGSVDALAQRAAGNLLDPR